MEVLLRFIRMLFSWNSASPPLESVERTSEEASDTEEWQEEEVVMSIPISLEHKRVIQSILSVFETGKVDGDYGAAIVLQDGAGISYGKHQSTDRSDSLDAIVYRYADLGGRYSGDLARYLPQLEEDATALVDPENLPVWVRELMGLLTEAGRSDVLMQKAQDQIFDELYWSPAVDQAMAMKLVLPLSWLVVYDSTIHSGVHGVATIRRRFPQVPPSRGGDEKEWVKAYLNARRSWLAGSSKAAVQATVYRIDSMLQLVQENNWDLQTPLTLRKPHVTVR